MTLRECRDALTMAATSLDAIAGGDTNPYHMGYLRKREMVARALKVIDDLANIRDALDALGYGPPGACAKNLERDER